MLREGVTDWTGAGAAAGACLGAPKPPNEVVACFCEGAGAGEGDGAAGLGDSLAELPNPPNEVLLLEDEPDVDPLVFEPLLVDDVVLEELLPEEPAKAGLAADMASTRLAASAVQRDRPTDRCCM